MSQPVEAGVPAVVTALVGDQCGRGDTVTVACPAGGTLAGSVQELGAAWRPWPARRSPGPSTAREVMALRTIVNDLAPDVVVLHSAKAGLAGRLAIRSRFPTVFVPHAWSFQAVTGPMQRLAEVWERVAQCWTAVTVCVSEDEKARGRRLGITGPMTVIRNGVDLDAFRPAPMRAEPPDGPRRPNRTVVCVGRLARQKGQDLLLSAWPTVRAAVPNVELVLVGDGPDRQVLQRDAPPGVRLVGARTDVSRWYAIADVVVIPSRWETMSIVALEALAAGRPVVAFAFDGARECLGAVGAVVPIGDIAGLASALVRLLGDERLMAAEAHKACARAEHVGDLRRTLHGWRCLLDDLHGDNVRSDQGTG